MGWWESDVEWLRTFKPFSNLKTTFCIHWASTKKSVQRVWKYNQNGTGVMTTAKNKVLVWLLKIGGIKIMWGGIYLEGGERILLSRENPVIPYINANKKNSFHYLKNLKN